MIRVVLAYRCGGSAGIACCGGNVAHRLPVSFLRRQSLEHLKRFESGTRAPYWRHDERMSTKRMQSDVDGERKADFKRRKRKRPALAGPAFFEARNILLLRRGSRSGRGRGGSRSSSVSLRGFGSSRSGRGGSRSSGFFLLAGDNAEGQHGGKQDGDLLHDLISFMECGQQTEQIGDRVGDLYQRPHILRNSGKSSIAIIAFQDSAFRLSGFGRLNGQIGRNARYSLSRNSRSAHP